MRKVAVVVQDGVEPFGLGAMCEVWAEPYHPEDDNPVFDFVVATPRPGRVRGASGYDLHVDHDLGAAADADLVCVSPKRDYTAPSPEVVELVRAAHERGAHVFAHCTAAFVLGEAGLLDGRRCTTHWRHVGELAARYPAALLDPDVLYVQDGTIVTGAGSAAGLDAALHLMRQQFGAARAAAGRRRMVVPPHRDGGQAQFIARPVPCASRNPRHRCCVGVCEPLRGAQRRDPREAQHMSPRTFARRFRDETGTTPHAGCRPSGAGRRGAAGAHRPSGRLDRRGSRLRQRGGPAPPLHARSRRLAAAVPPYLRLLSSARRSAGTLLTGPGCGGMSSQLGETVADVELVDQLREGAPEALTELFELYGDRIHTHCFRRLGSWHEAEDATASVFLEVWRHRERVRLHEGVQRCRGCTASRRTCAVTRLVARAADCGSSAAFRIRQPRTTTPRRSPRAWTPRHGWAGSSPPSTRFPNGNGRSSPSSRGPA